MIFYFGIALLIAALFKLLSLGIKARRPKAKGFILGLVPGFSSNETRKKKRYYEVIVGYNYKGVNYETKVMVIKPNPQVGEEITVSLRENNPGSASIYDFRIEFTIAIVIAAIGIFLLLSNHRISNLF